MQVVIQTEDVCSKADEIIDETQVQQNSITNQIPNVMQLFFINCDL